MPALFLCLRVRSENALERHRTAIEIHSRIVIEIGFRDADLYSIVGIHYERKEGKPLRIGLGKGCVLVVVLERIMELLLEGVVFFSYVRDPCVPVLRKREFGLLAHNFVAAFFRGRNETVGQAFIVGPELDVVLLVLERKIIIDFIDCLFHVL